MSAIGLPLASVPRIPLLVPVNTGTGRGAVLVLEGFDDVGVQIVDVVEEASHPVLEVVRARDLLATCLDGDPLGHESVDGIGVMRVPDVVPERADDLR